jgi:putative membrane protein insertion efficiency factor
MKNVCLFLIRIYQSLLGPFFGGNCRFYPSCSNYASEAIQRHGARRGASLAMRRVLRCHPFSPGGVDLVPDAPGGNAAAAACSPRAGVDRPTEDFAR